MIVQVDKGSAQQVNSPNYLSCAHQMKDRIDTPNKNKNNAIFDYLNFNKYYVEIDSQRYPGDGVLINFVENESIEQYKNIKFFFKEYIGEPILSPFTSYPDMETKYPIEKIVLRHQSDHIKPKKNQLFQEYDANPDKPRLYLILIRRREVELISDGNNLTEVRVK